MTAHAFVLMTQAALESLSEGLQDGVRETDRIDMLLERAGDGVRAGLALPASVRRWVEHLALGELGGSLERAVERLGALPLPRDPGDLDALIPCVRERDRVESIVVGIQRACFGSSRFVADVPGAEAALVLLEQVDAALGERVGRSTVERALELRIALLGEDGWTARLPLSEDIVDDASFRVEWPTGSVVVRPSESHVAAYVDMGRHASSVEAFAAYEPGFAEVLEKTIDAFRTTGQQVSLVARRWERKQRVAPSATAAGEASVIPFGLPLANAAAIENANMGHELALGILGPTDAEGWLVVRDGRVHLTVVAGGTSVARVCLGTEAAHESRPGEWELSVSATAEPLTMVVECADGRRCEARLGLFDAGHSS